MRRSPCCPSCRPSAGWRPRSRPPRRGPGPRSCPFARPACRWGVACIHGRPRGAHGSTERVRQLLDQLEVLGRAEAPSARDDDPGGAARALTPSATPGPRRHAHQLGAAALGRCRGKRCRAHRDDTLLVGAPHRRHRIAGVDVALERVGTFDRHDVADLRPCRAGLLPAASRSCRSWSRRGGDSRTDRPPRGSVPPAPRRRAARKARRSTCSTRRTPGTCAAACATPAQPWPATRRSTSGPSWPAAVTACSVALSRL